MARRPGATEARDEGELTYGQRDPKMKAAVKESSTLEKDVGRTGRGSRGGTTSRCNFTVTRDSTPFGFRGGGVDTTPSVNCSFSSSPPSSPPPVRGGADGDETPRWLGLGTPGGVVATYL
jgi:hypothetical protein